MYMEMYIMFLKFCFRVEQDKKPDLGPVGMERHQRQVEAEATARRLAREAEMELAAELAKKLYIQGEELAERHHKEIEYLAAKQNAETQKLSAEGQERVKDILKAQASVVQGVGAIPKHTAKQAGPTDGTQGGNQGGKSGTTIFKKMDE